MATAVYRVQCSAPLYGDPSQNMSNTFHFIGLPGQSQQQDLVEAFARLAAFYLAIDAYYTNSLTGNTLTMLAYDLGDPEPRTPIGDTTTTMAIGSGTPYPSDVSICLSYRAEYPSGAQRARRRGRVYIGPLKATTGEVVSQQGIRVTAATVTGILDAAELLADQIATPLLWAIYSPTDNLAWPIVEASVDNGFDTRRSRDNRATTRTVRTITV